MKSWIEKRPEVRKLKKEETSWLAGVIDGEGSVGLYDFGREGRRVSITLGNTNKEFVLRAREIIGCGSTVFRTNMHLSHKGRKPMYMYGLKGSNRCYWVLKQIISYLIIKKDKAMDIIGELEDKPFGRWLNCTEEYRKLNSERLKKEWQNPAIRKNRIEGIRKYFLTRSVKLKQSVN